ncbi:MAG: D-tyrosyl-tRNA(Tyr) deacylase [Bacilli bacterium]|nr:D-tyrosyl-tRNA(Tyr) deacylase [Bacilli bacterium]
MRVILTTVKSANVKIEDKMVGSIQLGYLLLVGFTDGDDKETVDKMVDKILSLRVFPDDHGQINISLEEVNGSILSVSQFTLYANTKKGRRPSFVDALYPGAAEPLYNYFNEQLEAKYGRVSTGIFGADMLVTSENLGPFTLILDSKELFN